MRGPSRRQRTRLSLATSLDRSVGQRGEGKKWRSRVFPMEILMNMTGSERVIPPVAYFFLFLAARDVSRGAVANQSSEETERNSRRCICLVIPDGKRTRC